MAIRRTLHLISSVPEPFPAEHRVRVLEGPRCPPKLIAQEITTSHVWSAPTLLSLQRTAGNRATGLLVGGQHSPRGSEVCKVVQRDLAPGRLNVAGEQHPESGKQRQDEIAFMKSGLGKKSTYWLEHEFLTATGDWADPRPLRLAQITADWVTLDTILAKVLPLIEKHRGAWTQPTVPGGQLDGTSIIRSAVDKLPLVGKLLHEKEVELAAGDPLLAGVKNACEGIPTLWNSITQDLKNIKEEVDPANQINHCDSLLKSLKSLRQSLDAISSVVVAKYGSDKDNIRFDRSRAMHAAANASATQVGLWKVGDHHVEDILRIDPTNQRAYHLMTRQEFLKDFTKRESGERCVVQ